MAIGDATIVQRSMSARMFSTVTTVALVAVSVGLMLLLLSMKDSGRKSFERGIGNMHMLISRDSSPLVSVLNGVFYANPPANPITWQEFEGLRGSLRFPLVMIPTQQGDSYRGRPVMATVPEFFTDFEPVQGEPFEFASGEAFDAPFEVVVGSEAARAAVLSVGDTINLRHGGPRDPDAHVHDEYDYTVVGILEPTGSPHDRALFTDLTSSWTLHAHDRRLQEIGPDAVTTPDDLVDADKLITGIYGRAIGRPGSSGPPAYLPQVLVQLRRNPSFVVAEPSGEINRLFEIVGNIDKILIAMAGAVMASSAIAIMLAMYNSMEQRRRQIALLRVLGASRARIFRLVIVESALIGLIGAVLGTLVATVGGVVVAGVLEARLGLVVTPSFGWQLAGAVVGATVGLAVVAGLVPAIAGYKTSVVRNLRPLG
ncbi:MAG: FtsX-like permease family protein [Phycisphaerales bacterium]